MLVLDEDYSGLGWCSLLEIDGSQLGRGRTKDVTTTVEML